MTGWVAHFIAPDEDLDAAPLLAVLRSSGYAGPIGLEYFPTVASGASVEVIRSAAATA